MLEYRNEGEFDMVQIANHNGKTSVYLNDREYEQLCSSMVKGKDEPRFQLTASTMKGRNCLVVRHHPKGVRFAVNLGARSC